MILAENLGALNLQMSPAQLIKRQTPALADGRFNQQIKNCPITSYLQTEGRIANVPRRRS